MKLPTMQILTKLLYMVKINLSSLRNLINLPSIHLYPFMQDFSYKIQKKMVKIKVGEGIQHLDVFISILEYN